MAINKKLIHFRSKSVFDQELANNQILDTSIVFIQDTQQIWTHGQLYDCSGGGGISGLTPVVYHESSETSLELVPGVLHKWDAESPLTSLSFTLPDDADDSVNNYKLVFTIGEDFSIGVPDYLKWENDTIPEFVEGLRCEMNIEDRRIVCAIFPLPTVEGTELHYIDNGGTDYILTDYTFSSNDCGYEIKGSMAEKKSSYQCLAGAGTTLSDIPFAFWFWTETGALTEYWSGTKTTIISTPAVGTVYGIKKTKTAITISSTNPLAVFTAGGHPSPSTNMANGRFYYLKLFNASGELNLYLKPFKRKSDGAIGLIDYISGRFYPSVNGTLTTLEEVEGEYLEYVENDGVDYVPTDYLTSNEDTGFEIKTSILSENNSYDYLFGACNSTTASYTPMGLYTRKASKEIYSIWDGTSTSILTGYVLGTDCYVFTIEKTALSMECPYPMFIFTRNNTSSSVSTSTAGTSHSRIYYLKVFGAEGKVNAYFRPFRRTSDNALGFKDEVSGMFYPSVNGALIPAGFIRIQVMNLATTETVYYLVEDTMTWNEFVNSSLNDGKFTIVNGYVKASGTTESSILYTNEEDLEVTPDMAVSIDSLYVYNAD